MRAPPSLGGRGGVAPGGEAVTTATTPPLLSMEGVTRRFGGFAAVEDVSLSVSKGEVLGLIGENGAGKSTLLNLISGTDHASAGTLTVRGRVADYTSYHEAATHGVFRVFQELALLPNLSVWENLFIGHEEHFQRFGIIDRRSAITRAREIMERFDHGWIDVERRVESYPFAVCQMIELFRAFALSELLEQEDPIILLDEPTAALDHDEVEYLHSMIESIRDRSAIIFVSHRLAELLEWSDRVAVLKDGRLVGQGDADSMSEESLHYLMVGRERDQVFYREGRQREPGPTELLRVEGLGDGESFQGVDLRVREGEIVGIAGVLGSGKSEVGRAVFGDRPATGTVRTRGELRTRRSPRHSARLQVAYVPPERKVDGFFDTMTVSDNIAIGSVVARNRGWVFPRAAQRVARRMIDRIHIKTGGDTASILALSGGNQQKVVFARCLSTDVKLLILDNPTRGVDAGAKEEIYDLIRDLTDEGVGILLVSDDLLELIGLSNEIVVMKGGRVTARVSAPTDAKPAEQELISRMV